MGEGVRDIYKIGSPIKLPIIAGMRFCAMNSPTVASAPYLYNQGNGDKVDR